MKILLTGASGFIGSEIFSRFRAQHLEIIGLTRHNYKSKNIFYCVDISNKKEVEHFASINEPCDVIIHAAACTNKNKYSESVIDSNCSGTKNVLWLADKWSTNTFIYLSGVNVIGEPQITPITEEHPTSPLTAYHASKLFGEHLTKIIRGEKSFQILRLTSPIGPTMHSSRLLSKCIENAINNHPITILGSGGRLQNYIDVRDIVNAVIKCIHAKKNGIYNIGGSDTISNLNLARQCINYFNSSSNIIFSGKPDPEEIFDWSISQLKSFKEIGYKPKFTIVDSIRYITEKIHANYD